MAAKCSPEESFLDPIIEAGLTAVELYIDDYWLGKTDKIVPLCEKYPLRYAIHAPSLGYEPDLLIALAEQIKPEVIVFHNIYWENEWEYLVENLSPLAGKLCVENTINVVENFKYLRRFGLGLCLDLEHLILEVNGIFEEVFPNVIKLSKHVHMSGYVWGSRLWHTPIHHSPEQSILLLNLLEKEGYSGMVVSEASTTYQTLDQFKAVYNFFRNWENNHQQS